MFHYVPEAFKAETATTEEEADAWLEDNLNNRRPPDLLTRDVVARAILAEVKAGRGSPHGGALLDIASRRPPDFIKRKLPSMYHQFKELAGVDITKEPMEVGPTYHYAMGGIRVDADTAAATAPGLFAAGETAAGLHGANRLGGNSLSDLLVFGRRAGLGATEYAKKLQAAPVVDAGQVEEAARAALAPLERASGENPYDLHAELQETMEQHVGIIRTEESLRQGIGKLEELKGRAEQVKAIGTRHYNPGWHLAIDLSSLLTMSEAVARAALERKESRGAHTRDDYPDYDPDLAKVNVVVRLVDRETRVVQEPLPQMPQELQNLIEEET
jgi:succinate dehydrogenase / fumarate reductase flavoprotein subunit